MSINSPRALLTLIMPFNFIQVVNLSNARDSHCSSIPSISMAFAGCIHVVNIFLLLSGSANVTNIPNLQATTWYTWLCDSVQIVCADCNNASLYHLKGASQPAVPRCSLPCVCNGYQYYRVSSHSPMNQPFSGISLRYHQAGGRKSQ